MTRQRDIVIIGSGLAGASAACQAAHTGLNVIALSRPSDPGYWAKVRAIPQFPGMHEAKSGSEFIGSIKKQAELFGAVFQEMEVVSIKESEKHIFNISGNNGDYYEAPVVIIASGVHKDNHLLAGEKELAGKGVFYSAENDAPAAKHQSVTVVGKSEEAVNAALYLARFADKIFFVIPSSKLDAPEQAVRNLETNKKIELIFSSSVKKLSGEDELHSVTILSAGSERELKTRFAFIYTHTPTPATAFAKELIELDKESGRIPVNPDLSSSKRGVFACGDVLAGKLQNPAVSIAQGTIAAISAEKFLLS